MISSMQALHLAATVLTISAGQLLFKLASAAWGPDNGLGGVVGLLHSGWMWAALAVYGLATVAWVALLRTVPLSLAYPFFALAFFIVPLLSWWFLNEPMGLRQWVGAALIALGVWVSAR